MHDWKVEYIATPYQMPKLWDLRMIMNDDLGGNILGGGS
jgi:hypothetical protein